LYTSQAWRLFVLFFFFIQVQLADAPKDKRLREQSKEENQKFVN
jgi:hypothetical protein